MPRTSNQKLKLLYLADILLSETDEDHPLTLREIISKLKGFDISADRKTLYQDFEVLREYGYDIISEKRGRSCCYFLGERSFELPELKLLVDSVQSAKFITDKKSGATGGNTSYVKRFYRRWKRYYVETETSTYELLPYLPDRSKH